MPKYHVYNLREKMTDMAVEVRRLKIAIPDLDTDTAVYHRAHAITALERASKLIEEAEKHVSEISDEIPDEDKD